MRLAQGNRDLPRVVEKVTGSPSAPLYLSAGIALSRPKNALIIRGGCSSSEVLAGLELCPFATHVSVTRPNAPVRRLMMFFLFIR